MTEAMTPSLLLLLLYRTVPFFSCFPIPRWGAGENERKRMAMDEERAETGGGDESSAEAELAPPGRRGRPNHPALRGWGRGRRAGGETGRGRVRAQTSRVQAAEEERGGEVENARAPSHSSLLLRGRLSPAPLSHTNKMPPRTATLPAGAVAPDAAAAASGVDPDVGLSSAEAARRLAAHGPNSLAQEPPTPMWRLVLAQFDDMRVKVRARREGCGVGRACACETRRERATAASECFSSC